MVKGMPNKLRGAWTWFVEGLVEALLWAVDRAGRSAPMRLEMDDGEAAVVDASGRRIGRLAGRDGPARFEPPDLAKRLSGAAIDVVIPPAWLFRRDLEPVAVASRPFLDAFVRHQIERITPWRVGDTHYRILERPVPDDPGRVAVSVALVPRRLVAGVRAARAPGTTGSGTGLRPTPPPAGGAPPVPARRTRPYRSAADGRSSRLRCDAASSGAWERRRSSWSASSAFSSGRRGWCATTSTTRTA